MNAVDEVLRFLGEVVLYGGGSAAVAYIVFQHLGKGWIDARFAERLEAFKHEQAKELQRMKIEVESVLSGALKLQDREFTVLPDAWQKLDEAYSVTQWFVAPAQVYPGLGQMADDELDEFLATSELLESQKSRVRASDSRERDKTYQELIFWHRLGRAKKAVRDLQVYVASQGLFLHAPLKQHFSDILPILWNALSSKEIGHEEQDWKMQHDGWNELQSKAEPLRKLIEEAIAVRLHSHGSTNRGD